MCSCKCLDTQVYWVLVIMFLIVALSQKHLKAIELDSKFYEDRNSILYPIPS